MAAIPKLPPLKPGCVVVDRDHGIHTIVDEVGRGGLGLVYHATSPEHGDVAIKVPRKLSHLADLMLELRWVSGMQIPNTVIPIGMGEHEFAELPDIPIPFIVMPLFPFGSISDFIALRHQENGDVHEFVPAFRFPIAIAARWGVQVARALKRLEIVHRDIKPENLFLDSEHNAYLGDFGLAMPATPERRAVCSISVTNNPVGTVDYMSPEQFACKANIDARSDIYALGLLLFEMVTGTPARAAYHPPKDGDSAKRAYDMSDLLNRDGYAIPLDHIGDRNLRRIIDRCTKPEIAKRYPDHDDFIADLMALADMPSRLSPASRASLVRGYTDT